MPEPGEAVLVNMQFTDAFEIKKRTALVLFEEYDNIAVAGITSNRAMKGVALTKKDSAIKDSVTKLNYIFTVSTMITKKLFSLPQKKKIEVFDALVGKLDGLL